MKFAKALGRKDAVALKEILHPDVNFRAMTPGGFWEADEANQVIDEILLGKWFEPTDEITEVVAIETDRIGPRERVGYRFKITNPDGKHVVEQQAYFEPEGDRIRWLRVMCAGMLPEA
jgi:hypothetical protein